jgi:hypothetical protein
VGDRVVVEFKSEDTREGMQGTVNWGTGKVIGFVDNPKPCDEYAVYTVSCFWSSVVVVWDIANNAVFTDGGNFSSPCQSTDPAYVTWFTGRSSAGENLFSNFLHDTVHPHKLRPDLVDTDQVDYHRDGQDQWARWLLAETIYANVLLPQYSPENPVYWGLRTEKHGWNTATPLYKFIGPMGELGSFQVLINFDTQPEGYGSYYYGIHTIPFWQPTSMTDISDPALAYALSRYWYGSTCWGRFTERSIAAAIVVNYVPCDYTDYHVPYPSPLNACTFTYYPRVVMVQAFAVQPAGGTAGYDITSEISNSALSAALETAVALAYSLESVPENEIRNCQISVTIVQ